MSENSFDITSSIIHSELTSTSSVFGSIGSPIAFRSQLDSFVDDEDLFIHTGTVGSNDCPSLSTRLRRRKASQPQRLIYCELNYSPTTPSTVTTPSSGQTSQETSPSPTNEGLFKCNSCEARFDDKNNLRSHKKSVHGPSDGKKKTCNLCGTVVFNTSALKNHHKRVHEKSERTFQCDLCLKKFFSKAELTQHSFIHCDEKKFKCDLCDKKFASRAYLERHSKTHQGLKPFQCEICHKQLADKTGFVAHVRAHKGEKPFQCNVCEKRYTIKRHLTSHMRIHSNLRPFTCDFPGCSKTFRSRSNWRMHKDFHAGVKRWSCSYCGRSFLSQGNMAKHVRRHVGEKRFSCDICGKGFIERQELKSHQKIHTHVTTTDAIDLIPVPPNCVNVINNTSGHAVTDVNGQSGHIECTAEEASSTLNDTSNETGMVMITVLDGQTCSVLESTSQVSTPLNRTPTITFASDFSTDHSSNDQNKLPALSFDFQIQEQIFNCTLCSCGFPLESMLREHLLDYHRVEPDKIH